MNVKDKTLLKLSQRSNNGLVTTVYLDNKNISKFSLNSMCFIKIEFLSLRSNQIKNVSFLKSIPNLWYLDLRDNQVYYFLFLD